MQNHDTHSAKASAAANSIIASLLMTAAKLLVALVTGSLAVLSEALHSTIDLGATILTWFAVKFADAPADDDHHYGHAKIESLAALVEAVLLMGTALYVAFEAVIHLLRGAELVQVQWWAFVLFGCGIMIDLWRSSVLRRVATQEASAALAADAKHFEADIYASVAVIIGLAGAALGFPKADSIAALVVSAFIFWLGIKMGGETISALLDRAPEGSASLLRKALAEEKSLIGISRLQVRQVGPVAYISLAAQVPRSLTTGELAALSLRVKEHVQAALPGADLSLALDPVALDSESLQQRVMAIAADKGLSVHHLVVQDFGERRAVSFDVEMPPQLSLGEAHDRATELESAIRQSLGGDLEVESHVEPKPAEHLASRDASKAELAAAAKALQSAVRGEKLLSDVHNIRLRALGQGRYLHYHCRFAPQLSLEQCHAVLDRVEARLISKLPKLMRVIAHAEPVGHAQHKL